MIDISMCPVISLVGKRCSGKSLMMKYLLHLYRKKFHKIYVICPTDFNSFWKSQVDEKNIKDKYDDDFVTSLIQRMTIANKDKTKDDKDFKRVLIILDDVVNDTSMHHKAPAIKILVGRGRHLGICCWITAQMLHSISPVMRQNTDYMFLGKMNKHGLEICEKEFRVNMDKKPFQRMLEETAGNDYQFLLINQATASIDPNDIYRSVRVPEGFLKK